MSISVKKHDSSLPRILQVEISSSCNANCVYCPRTILRDSWISTFMNPKLFRKIIKEALEVRTIEYMHLQGWGEPMLHPNFMNLVNEISGKVNFGFTTNATLLHRDHAEKLLSKGISVIAISFAGAHAATHDLIRRGCDFNKIIRNVKDLIAVKRSVGSDVRVIASFIMLPMNIHELPEFMELCSGLGIEEVTLDNLSYVLSRNMITWRAFSDPYEEESKHVKRIVDMAMRRAKELGIKAFSYSLTCWELIECPEKPTETIFINVNGEVSPCVFLNLPVNGHEIPRCFMGRCFKLGKVSFGNINDKHLIDVWLSKDYIDFRVKFSRRSLLEGELMNLVEDYAFEYLPPQQCISCYRLYGV